MIIDYNDNDNRLTLDLSPKGKKRRVKDYTSYEFL